MMLTNGANRYRVGEPVAETDAYRVYLCVQEETERQCLLQIASAIEHNGELDRAAYILKQLTLSAKAAEKVYAKRTDHEPGRLLNYQLGFPEVIDGFFCKEQGRRRVNILAFRGIEEVSDVVPLDNITYKDQLQIDLRTSGWIVGKALKLVAFVHGSGIAIHLTGGSNVLIVPDRHYVEFFDMSKAQIYPAEVPAEDRCHDITQAAQAVVTALGSNLSEALASGDKNTQKYADYLSRLAHGSESNARLAHTRFYELVDALWPREYYPFTAEPRFD